MGWFDGKKGMILGVANDFSIARSIRNMHDALLIEQRRTNQLLEWIGGLLQARTDTGTPRGA